MKTQSEDLLKSWSKFAKSYDPIKCASIDGIDCDPHDRAVIRAINNEYRPNKFVKGNPECTIFVSRLNHETSKDTIKDIFSKYGKLKRFRMVRDVVTGMSKGYAFVEYEEEQSAEEAYRLANKMVVDGTAIFVDFECERLLKGWKPRRLGGGFGGKKESGQLRFGGRDRPFKKPIALELKEQEEKRQRERDRRLKEDDRRRRGRSRDKHRKTSPVRENRTRSPAKIRNDKKKEEDRRGKSPLPAKKSDSKKPAARKSPLKENGKSFQQKDLPVVNGREKMASKDSRENDNLVAIKDKPKSDAGSSLKRQERDKPKSPTRDNNRPRKRSPERSSEDLRSSKDGKPRSLSTDKLTRNSVVDGKRKSPVRKISRERRDFRRAASPVPSRNRNSPFSSRSARRPPTPQERDSRRSSPKSRGPTRPILNKRSERSPDVERTRQRSPLSRNRDRTLGGDRHRSRSPIRAEGTATQSLASRRQGLSSLEREHSPLIRGEERSRGVYHAVSYRSRSPPRDIRRLQHSPEERYISPTLVRDNLYRQEDIPLSYQENSPVQERTRFSPPYNRTDSPYEYRSRSPYRDQLSPADGYQRYDEYLSYRESYSGADLNVDEYSLSYAESRRQHESPVRERSTERIYSEDNMHIHYSARSHDEYDYYERSYGESPNDQFRGEYTGHYEPRKRHEVPYRLSLTEELEMREMHWDGQSSRSLMAQNEDNNYDQRRSKRENVRSVERSSVLHLKQLASSFRR